MQAFLPSHAEMDVVRRNTVREALERYDEPDGLVHTASYPDIKGAQTDREACWWVNVGGTRSVVREPSGSRVTLVHVSTDCVFWGDTVGYLEEDPVGPTRNYCTLSRHATSSGRDSARAGGRTPWRSPTCTRARTTWTSSRKVALAIRHALEIPVDTERKSFYDFARRRNPGVRAGTRSEAGGDLPEDVSLSTGRRQAIESKPNLVAGGEAR